jgi:anthranilate synthase component 1
VSGCIPATVFPGHPAVPVYSPDFETFCRLAEGVNLVPVFRRLVGDALTPVSAFALLRARSGGFLFESVIGGERVGRYSFVGGDPFLEIEACDREVVIRDHREDAPLREQTFQSPDPLAELERLLGQFKAAHPPGLPRFCGGAVGYAGYDTVRYVERLPNPPTDDRKLPDLAFGFYDRMLVFHHINKTIQVVAQARVTDAKGQPRDLRTAYDEACRAVDELCQRLQRNRSDLQITDIQIEGQPSLPAKSNHTRESFEANVTKSQEYIRAGDIFQVVLSQRFELETQARALDIYRALRVVNPSPFMFLLESSRCTLVGSSPEIMVRVDEGEVTIRPLAGTRRRGATEEEDRALAEELLADPKERAEHVMLVDLARNDLGRVSEYGSVQISDVMVVERYSHVMHITSNARGHLRADKTALDALRSGLPAGTVSGAPKVRAMQIIDELEPHRRGPYGGAVGYVDFTGNMDTCIALRTLVLVGQTAYIQAGAGIVADSVPEQEYFETVNKAKGLLKAIEIAERQL